MAQTNFAEEGTLTHTGAAGSVTRASRASSEYIGLIWKTFFVGKRRGVSMSRHFPWIGTAADVFFFENWHDGKFCGGLVLKVRQLCVDGRMRKIGLIGLVCVEPEVQRAGVGSALLSHAIAFSANYGIDALALWSRRHDFYARHGFLAADRWMFGDVSAPQSTEYEITQENLLMAGFVENMSLPLPPFSSGIFEYCSDLVELTVLRGPDGIALAQYSGPADVAATKLLAFFPGSWRLNAVERDPLIDHLIAAGATLRLRHVNLQMWLPLSQAAFELPPNSLHIPMLERL